MNLKKFSEVHYVRVGFEGHPDVVPLLTALQSDLTVVYAGALDPRVIDSGGVSRRARQGERDSFCNRALYHSDRGK